MRSYSETFIIQVIIMMQRLTPNARSNLSVKIPIHQTHFFSSVDLDKSWFSWSPKLWLFNQFLAEWEFDKMRINEFNGMSFCSHSESQLCLAICFLYWTSILSWNWFSMPALHFLLQCHWWIKYMHVLKHVPRMIIFAYVRMKSTLVPL